MTTARYIVFEGGEGSGKSTQAARLAARIDAHLTFEPGATALGSELRAMLLDIGRATVGARAETLLMAADRAQHVVDVVEPVLGAGRHVVSDRCLYSSMAYQGGGRRLGLDVVRSINEWAVSGRLPDLVVFLDLAPEQARTRLGRSLDRLELEGQEFHERVRTAYRSMAAADPERWITIDGSPEPDVVAAAVWTEVTQRLDLS